MSEINPYSGSYDNLLAIVRRPVDPTAVFSQSISNDLSAKSRRGSVDDVVNRMPTTDVHSQAYGVLYKGDQRPKYHPMIDAKKPKNPRMYTKEGARRRGRRILYSVSSRYKDDHRRFYDRMRKIRKGKHVSKEEQNRARRLFNMNQL